MKDKKNLPVPVDELEKRIAAFVTIDDYKDGKDQLEMLKVFANKKGVERSLVQRINAGAVRCAWEIGGLLKEVISRGRPSEEEKGKRVHLHDLGIQKTSSHRYQIINNIPKDLLNERIDKMMADDSEITEKEFYKFAKSLEDEHHDNSSGEEDGTSRMNENSEARDKFAFLAKNSLTELRAKNIPGIDQFTDVELELIARGIIETVMDGPGKVKNKVERFVAENTLTIKNYWNGFSYIIRQMKAVIMSLDSNTTPASPKSFLYFIRNLGSMLDLIKSWKPGTLDKCPVCEGKKELPAPAGVEGVEEGTLIPCDMCVDGYVGWFKK